MWIPSLLNPPRVAFSSTLKQLYQLLRCVWCAKPSNWVPTWPISDKTSSSLLPRSLVPAFMKVRLACMSKRRVGEIAIPGPSTWASSITSPVLISFTALSTDAGFMWLPEPRSSAVPHFDGQRLLSSGTIHDGACACAAVAIMTAIDTTTPIVIRFIAVLPA